MRFGLHFIPTLEPSSPNAMRYFDECFDLAERAEALGYASIKIGEHYFYQYGGACPDPIAFLSAASQRTRTIRLATGAVFPAFNHPLRLAGQLLMLDNLSHGRLDAGFGRSFFPGEFDAFEVEIDQSWDRFCEGVEAIQRLWVGENVVWQGRYHRFGPVTLYPRPAQTPHPPVWVTATYTPEIFEWCGRQGYRLTLIPYVTSPENITNLTSIYRKAWNDAGHAPGAERIQMTFHCLVDESGDRAREESRRHFDEYRSKLLEAVEPWNSRRAEQYPGYEHLSRAIRKATFEGALRQGHLLIGTPDELVRLLGEARSRYGEFEPNLLVNFGSMPHQQSIRSLELFAQQVMPQFDASPLLSALPG
jgi:alkanesulfonate monooxygenase SsuD/methylene tetrahydromethanopterin reductase-like flavin-dependent oxidoreductase (luciferase family)